LGCRILLTPTTVYRPVGSLGGLAGDYFTVSNFANYPGTVVLATGTGSLKTVLHPYSRIKNLPNVVATDEWTDIASS
jgi:hypothetical protein